MTRKQVYEVIDSERDYQDTVWSGHKHETGAYILLLKSYIDKAMEAWVVNDGDKPSLEVIRKVAGIAVNCMEEHGAPYREI